MNAALTTSLNSAPEVAPFLRDLFADASPELLRLFQGAVENAAALPSDFHTIQDWLDIAGCREESVAVLLLLLILAREDGSLCVELARDNLERRLADLVVGEQQGMVASSWAARILADLQADNFPTLIGRHPEADRPVIVHESEGRRFLYFQKYLRHELTFAQDYHRRSALPRTPPDEHGKAAVLQQVLEDLPLRVAGKPLQLDVDQRRAVEAGLEWPLAVISGGPGTGKTSIVVTLLRCLVRLGIPPERIALAAPTGRAAQRLADALRQGLASLGATGISPSPPGTPGGEGRGEGGQHATRQMAGSARDAGPLSPTPLPLSTGGEGGGSSSSPSGDPTPGTEYLDSDASLAAIEPVTLHKLLGYDSRRDLFRRHAENPIAADVVIVDEVSMVGLVLMSKLLQACRPEARLILLGDKDQLPSVDAGAVLANLVPAGEEDTRGAPSSPRGVNSPFIVLRTNHRSVGELSEAALAIKRRDLAWIDTLAPLGWDGIAEATGCRLVELTARTPPEIRRILRHWAEHAYLRSGLMKFAADWELPAHPEEDPLAQVKLRRLFELLEQNRLLTLVRDGPWGCDSINDWLAGHLRPRGPGERLGGRAELFPGAPILITRNDYTQQLFNGDVGLVLRGVNGLRVAFPRRGQYLVLPVDALPPHELGFALTVHKSQGSEYGQVLVVLPPEGARKLLTRELVYTALTRAKRLAILGAAKDTLRLAVQHETMRESGVFATG